MANGNRCFKCGSDCVLKEEKQKLFGFPCDMCCKIVCANCTNAQAQEIRVIPSQTRTLICLCPDCSTDFKQIPTLFKAVKTMKGEIVALKDHIKKMEQKMEAKLKSTDDTSKIASIQQELKQLKNKVDEKSDSGLVDEKFSLIQEKLQKHEDICHIITDDNTKLVSIQQELEQLKSKGQSQMQIGDIKQHMDEQTERIAVKLESFAQVIKESNTELVRFLMPDAHGKSKGHGSGGQKSIKQGGRQQPHHLTNPPSGSLSSTLGQLDGAYRQPNANAELNGNGSRDSHSHSALDGLTVASAAGGVDGGDYERFDDITSVTVTRDFSVFASLFSLNTTQAKLERMLNCKLNCNNIKCEELNQNKTNKTYKSFKVTADPIHKDKLFDLSTWPSGIIVRPCKRDFFRRPTNRQTGRQQRQHGFAY